VVDSNSGDLILIDPDDQHPDYQWGQLTDVVDEASYEWKYERIATSDALGIIQERVIDRVPKLIGPRLQQVFDDIWADKLAYFESIGATTAPVNESQHPNSIVE